VYEAKIGQLIFAITILPIFFRYRVYWPNTRCHLFGPNSGARPGGLGNMLFMAKKHSHNVGIQDQRMF
jgi:hypothetical protein